MDDASQRSPSQTLTALRGLIYQEPGRHSWLALCATLDRCPPHSLGVAVDYLRPSLDVWANQLAQRDPSLLLQLTPPLAWIEAWLQQRQTELLRLTLALELSQSICDTPQAASLLLDPRIERLHALSLGGHRCTHAFFEALEQAPWLGSLRYLGCRRCNMPSEVGVALAELGRQIPRLRALDLDQNLLEDRAVETLASVTAWGRLSSLNLRNNQAGPRGASALARAPHLASLRHLDLSLNHLGDDGTLALEDAHWLPCLSSLSLVRNQLTAQSGQHLALLPFEALEHLALGWNGLGHEGLGPLLQAPWAQRLRSLDLTDNKIGDQGAWLLARAHGLRQLHTLNLRYNQITDAGVEALARSPHLGSLERLPLEGNRISPEGLELLLSSPFLSATLKAYLRKFASVILRASRW